jgi:ubiquinone/menaquinone biosynthesis C-methylase UbiE
MTETPITSTNSGKVFDATAQFTQDLAPIHQFIDYYFTKEEIQGKTVLDAGCRVGDYVMAMAEKGVVKASGIDLSEDCVKVAQQRTQHIPNVAFYQGDITQMTQFENDSFDILICVGTIVYLPLPQMQIALKEFFRVVKDGGIILVLFQKKKGLILKLVRWVANILPLGLYKILVNIFAYILIPIVGFFAGRKVNLQTAKYLLIGLRGLYFGIPDGVSEEFRIKTITLEQCSEKSTASYKIKVKK